MGLPISHRFPDNPSVDHRLFYGSLDHIFTIYTVVKGNQTEYIAPSYLARERIFMQSPNLLCEVLDLLFNSERLRQKPQIFHTQTYGFM